MDTKKRIRPNLLNMEVGDFISFPIHRLKSVRVQASELGAILDRTYTTRMDKESRLILVLRTK